MYESEGMFSLFSFFKKIALSGCSFIRMPEVYFSKYLPKYFYACDLA